MTQAVVYADARRVEVRRVPDAQIEDPGDVVVRVTSSAICGTDLHMYDGRTGAEPGLVLGHEPLGTIEEVGGVVTLLQPGERVAVPTHLFCGLCFNCIRGYTAACLRVRPGSFGAAYGYAGMAPTAAHKPSCCGCPTPTPTASACRVSPATSPRTTSCCWRTRSSPAGMPPSWPR